MKDIQQILRDYTGGSISLEIAIKQLREAGSNKTADFLYFSHEKANTALEERSEKELEMLKSDLQDPEYANDQLEVDRLLDAINRLKKDPEKYFKEIDDEDNDSF